jgi:hypothetical protein
LSLGQAAQELGQTKLSAESALQFARFRYSWINPWRVAVAAASDRLFADTVFHFFVSFACSSPETVVWLARRLA